MTTHREWSKTGAGREYESAVLRTQCGLRELAEGRPDAALAAFRQALAVAPALAPLHNNLGLALGQLGQAADAEQAYRAALERDPGYAPAHHNLGEVLQRRGLLAEARACFESALRADPGLTQSLVSLGNTLADLGHLQEAVRCYREALSRGAPPAGVFMNLGVVLRQLGALEASVDALERSVAVEPSSAEAHFSLACARLQCGRAEAAVESAREALRLRPGLQEARKVCAMGMAAAGAPEAAVELLRQAGLSEWPKPQLYLLLAGQLISTRLLEPARRCLELALSESPNDAMLLHVFAALTGANPQTASGQYVRQVFDASAATFERDLVTNLRYGIPAEMVRALRSVVSEGDAAWDVLDLGCGTGLVGAEIAPFSRRLVGIDLSPKMIEQARARQIYTELHCTDILTELAAQLRGKTATTSSPRPTCSFTSAGWTS
jgi:predicted TPR repeat methyltransferase